jgi:hypothetical protein
LFILQQERNLYQIYQQQITECDTALAAYLQTLDDKVEPGSQPPAAEANKRAGSNAPTSFDVRGGTVLDLRCGTDMIDKAELKSRHSAGYVWHNGSSCFIDVSPLEGAARAIPHEHRIFDLKFELFSSVRDLLESRIHVDFAIAPTTVQNSIRFGPPATSYCSETRKTRNL